MFFESGGASTGTLLPSHLQAASFVDHMNATCDDNLVKHYRSQYKDSIPDPLKHKLGTAVHFIEEVAAAWEEEIQALFCGIEWSHETDPNGNPIPADRADIILCLAAILSKHCPDTKMADFVFIAAQVLANMKKYMTTCHLELFTNAMFHLVQALCQHLKSSFKSLVSHVLVSTTQRKELRV